MTGPGRSRHPPPRGTPERLADLRADLAGAGYTVEGLDELLGPVAAAALHREQRLPPLRALEGCSAPTAVLARVFVLGCPVGVAELDGALVRLGAAGAAALGLVTSANPDHPDEPGLQATCDLRPYGEGGATWWVASDPSELATGRPLPTDHVLGVGGASRTLASWTPRPRAARALDLGTGCGVQALHLHRHCAEVVATDLSSRALEYARFTAALNEVVLDLRSGSLLEPVAGEEFDLVVANPPFVITPRMPDVPVLEYRDGGRTGDALVAGLVRDVGGHLAPGGIAQLLGNWETRAGEDWRDRVGGWLERTDLDAWVVQREVLDPAQYAEVWARDGGYRPGAPELDALYAAWLDDFAARGVQRIGFGVLTLHRPRRTRLPWRDLEEATGPVGSRLGPHILRGLTARTWLAEHTSEELLDIPWRVAEDVTEERVGRPGAPEPFLVRLRQGGGLRRTVPLDTLGAALVSVCDGELSARQGLQAIAGLLDLDAPRALEDGARLLHRLVADGLVGTGDDLVSERSLS